MGCIASAGASRSKAWQLWVSRASAPGMARLIFRDHNLGSSVSHPRAWRLVTFGRRSSNSCSRASPARGMVSARSDGLVGWQKQWAGRV